VRPVIRTMVLTCSGDMPLVRVALKAEREAIYVSSITGEAF
jgi:hypothetical protein